MGEIEIVIENEEKMEIEKEKDSRKEGSFLKDSLKDIVIAIIIVFVIVSFIKPTVVKETSMLDTLQENNYLLVNKMIYKTKDHPTRGDIIVFHSELINEETGKKMLLIKRVIAVEGDTIKFDNNQVYLNGKLLKEDYIYDEASEYRAYPNGETYTIGKDEVFAMGDHRSVSLDSRASDVGMVSEDDIMGKAFVRLFPFDEIELL